MHHLVNEFRQDQYIFLHRKDMYSNIFLNNRPHQARETLRVMLHVQKKRRLLVSEKFAEVLEKVN